MPKTPKTDPLSALRELLANDNPSLTQVLSLASDASKSSEDEVRFTIDAGLMNRLGIELVSKQETAVAELVKNAYDADALTVDLIFKDSASPGGSLEIIDTGSGMTREQVIDGFMRISTTEKSQNPISEKYSRSRAGRKGIGRFSSQRLGSKLTIQTRRDDSPEGLQVVIDWDDFVPGKDLILVTHKIEKYKKPSVGTTLLIEGLRDSWSESNIQRSYRYVSTLQPPFPIAKQGRKTNYDPGFKIAFHLDQNKELITIADDAKNILAHALAVVSGHVGNDGRAYWSMEAQRFSIDIQDQGFDSNRDVPGSTYRFLKHAKFVGHYYIIHAALLPKPFYQEIKTTLEKWGGIRLYRNGFRVLPYGEPFDDWLRLDRSSAIRELLPPHANNNFVGYVELDDLQGNIFQETASREGLVENEAFAELQDFVARSLKKAAQEIAEARGKKVKASDKREKVQAPVEDILKELKRAVGSNKAALAQVATLEASVLDIVRESVQQIDEIAMLRVLGSLGLSIGEFTHEIRHSLSALTADALTIAERIPNNSAVLENAARLQENLKMLRAYARYFDDAVADNAHREVFPCEMRDVLNAFERIALPTATRAGVTVDVEVKGYDLYTRPMHRSEWSSILLNLFTNSVKAIRRAKPSGRILIRGGEDGGVIYVEIADDGDGIPDVNKSRIFDAFFTTSTPPSLLASPNEELMGAGLGLKITRDIVESHAGEIYLATPPAGFVTNFRVEIPKATDAEVANAEN